jgi:hypothetical protein
MEAAMMTKRQNFLETLHGGKPDRFVNQFDYMTPIFGVDPIYAPTPAFPPIGGSGKNIWGVTLEWREGQPGPFPVLDDAHKVIKDITKWRDVLHMPKTDYPAEAWEEAAKAFEAVDRKELYAAQCYFNGLFEALHYAMGIEDSLIALYDNPKEVHEIIDFFTEFELRFAEEVCKYCKPDALFHHDDWGTQQTLFLSPDMFREYLVPSYKKIYGYWKSHGVEIVVHHCDSYAAPLVPMMIETGIDVWQGCMSTNNLPELVKKYGPKMTFMGGLDSGIMDKAAWTPELIHREVEKACRGAGKLYFIPCLVQGLNLATFPGVYEATTAEIDKMSGEML